MLQLTELAIPEKGASIRIMDRIGSDYHTLGTCLLNDKDGGIMRTIEHDYKVSDKILNEVFHRWIKGLIQKDGKKTNSWETLIKSLNHSMLVNLADEIEAVLYFCSEKALHTDDEECVQEYRYKKTMETESFLHQLIPGPIVVAVIVGAAILYCCYYSRKSKHNIMIAY